MTRKRAVRKSAKTTTRKVGRPKSGEQPVTPAVLRRIGILWIEGWSKWEIAKEIGVNESTVRHHLNNTICPNWHEDMRSRLAEDLAKVAHVERTAWERFHAATPGETQEVVEKALLDGGSKPRIVKQAVKTVTKTGEVAWIQVIQWCLEFRARIHAHYTPTRTHIDHGGELRVAGKTPCEVDQEMLKRLMRQIAERRKHQAALDVGRN